MEARSFHDPSHNHVKFTVPGLGPRVREDMPIPLEHSGTTGRIFCLNRRGKCSGAQNTVPCDLYNCPCLARRQRPLVSLAHGTGLAISVQ